MAILDTCVARTLLMGIAISAALSFQAMADGTIVLSRDVHPHPVGTPPMRPDPNPTTVNADVSARVLQVTQGNELSDGDFAGVTSGTSINRLLMSDGATLRGFSNNSSGLPGMSSGQGSSSGAGISGQVNRSVQQGMGALNALGRGQ